MTQLALQHMAGLTHGGHQDQPCPNQGKHIVLKVETSTMTLDHHIWSRGGFSVPLLGRSSVDGREGRDWS